MSSLISMGQKAKEASYELGVASPGQKNEALTFMADELIKAKEEIIKANEIDRQNAIKKGIKSILPDTEVRVRPVADGGEGTTDALIYGRDGVSRERC